MAQDDDDMEFGAAKELNELFAGGFTVPLHLRMNSVYGKYASALDERENGLKLGSLALAYFTAVNMRTVMRVI